MSVESEASAPSVESEEELEETLVQEAEASEPSETNLDTSDVPASIPSENTDEDGEVVQSELDATAVVASEPPSDIEFISLAEGPEVMPSIP